MNVWVIMGNSYPECVRSSEEAAEAWIAERKAADKLEAEKLKMQGNSVGALSLRNIYWRAYQFTLDA